LKTPWRFLEKMCPKSGKKFRSASFPLPERGRAPLVRFQFPVFQRGAIMNVTKCVGLACALALSAGAVPLAGAKSFYSRQYYGDWKRYSKGGYYYRSYYYKPYSSYHGYRHHYAVYYPSKPKYTYFYNPYKKVYWGRCPSHCEPDQPRYSLLPEKYRKAHLEDIPENAFPPMKKMPPVPESNDNEDMEPPPDDLPQNASLPEKD
jgi:hypothetical protein